MDIIISLFKVVKEILDFVVILINIVMFLEVRAEKKRLKSKLNHRYKKRVPSKRKHR
ncbi:hypothetical protein PN294_13570 [Romboutsia sp. 1001216sp1]|uniref:hypothetical protein n=1 Tax=unclassified Romboutsia TaxID=2626894 RepID=UPI0018A0FAB3|nr:MULTISPECIES: hypothetical protein [unclassified Romboutsia]MDB8803213.1 hypothetical protein [Romboutsia sp. 1001216sp1]MDB8814572.1 hypothetical protein [Romboutsia sp. 1001216sp1]